MAELEALVGLDDVKTQVKKILSVMRTNMARRELGLPEEDYSLHFVFTGSPGTGKTTVARIMAKLLHGVGYLEKNLCVETDANGLIGQYVGHTGPKTEELIKKAMGGVLFIDEAYMLRVKANSQGFEGEAIATLLRNMENLRGKFVVIIAGYTKEMEETVQSNSGLKSRFTKFMELPDYSTAESSAIMYRMFKDKKYDASAEFMANVSLLIELIKQKEKGDYANGRTVRNYKQETIEQIALQMTDDAPTYESLTKLKVGYLPFGNLKISRADIDNSKLRWTEKLDGKERTYSYEEICKRDVKEPFPDLTAESIEYLKGVLPKDSKKISPEEAQRMLEELSRKLQEGMEPESGENTEPSVTEPTVH